MTTNLPIENIKTDAGTQVRVELDEERIESYGAAMQRGEQLPPLHVFQQNGEPFYILSDGYHRLAAARKLGKTEVEVEVHVGDRRDAVLFAIGVNARHGMPLDKRRAISVLLQDPEWREWNNSEIARVCGASDVYVGRMRKELSSNQFDDGSGRLVKRGGKTYRQKKQTRKRIAAPHARTASSQPEPVILRHADAGQAAPAEVAQSTEQNPKAAYEAIVISPWWDAISTDDLRNLPVCNDAAPTCTLVVATTSARMVEVIDIVRAWGFTCVDVWTGLVELRKANAIITNKEIHFVVAVRGAISAIVSSPLTARACLPSGGVDNLLRNVVKQRCPGRKLMLFGKTTVKGWDSKAA